MNTYYKLLQRLKSLFEEDQDVNSVTTGEFDQWKKDDFALVHLEFTASPFVENTSINRFDVLITAVDIRDINNEDTKDVFWFNDNRHDNWNLTYKILNLGLRKLQRDEDYDIVNVSSSEPLSWAFMNGLDGWQQTWTIDVIDESTNICVENERKRC